MGSVRFPRAPIAIALGLSAFLVGCGGGDSGGSPSDIQNPPPPPPTFVLTVTQSGSGSVTSNPSGISTTANGSVVSATYPGGTQVTLTASPASGWRMGSWSGACTGTATTCTVTLSQARAVTATFEEIPPPPKLQPGVAVTGLSGAQGSLTRWTIDVPEGTGRLRVNLSGGSGDPDLYVRRGTPPTTTAFDCRSNGASTIEECAIDNPAAGEWHVMVHGFATFAGVQLVAQLETLAPTTHTLSVTKSGQGTVTSNPAGISIATAGTSGTATYNQGTAVTLTATPAAGWRVAAWGGACSGTGTTCALTMSQDRSVTLTLEQIPAATQTLSVTKSGQGTVTSSPAGISIATAGTSGTATFNQGTAVTLTATPAAGWRVAAWGGACSGTGTTCALTMSQDRSVTLTLEEIPPASAFKIDLVYEGTVSASVRQLFDQATARWSGVMTRKLNPINLTVGADECGRTSDTPLQVDDLTIFVRIESIDGPGGTVGQAGPCYSRNSDGTIIVGQIIMDLDDLAGLQADNELYGVILHEMGHVLGIGTLWESRGFLQNPSLPNSPGVDTHFSGPMAIAAFNAVGGANYSGGKVPVENTQGGEGTRDGHWRLSVFGAELMVGFVQSTSPMSRVTIASLGDLGYGVNEGMADAYTLAAALQARVPTARDAVHMGDDMLRGRLGVVDDSGRVVRWLRTDGSFGR